MSRCILQVEFVLQPGTSATDHGHTQHPLRSALPLQQGRHLGARALTDLEQPLVTDANLDLFWGILLGDAGNHRDQLNDR